MQVFFIWLCNVNEEPVEALGPVVQSIVSLLRDQLVKCFTTLQPNTTEFCIEKNERGFCAAKASHIFSTKNSSIFQI